MKIKSKDLQKFQEQADFKPPVIHLYTAVTTSTTHNLEDLTIEKEFLYWTNSAKFQRFGTVHKAFTEPFGRAVPLQTFEEYDIERA